jgi:putative Mg2+ transporter-C (MgtC) family protein
MHRVVLSGNGEIAVRLGAALVIGAALVSLGLAGESKSIDPKAVSRVLQGILTGIGFLGAGVIMRDPSGHVTGLTSAATIWVCAALGAACGLGYWPVLGIAIGLTLVALGGPIERRAERLSKPRRSKPADPSA